MQGNGKKEGEDSVDEVAPVFQPKLRIQEGQVILDYMNVEDREKIRHVLYRHFDEGRSEASEIRKIVSSLGANPRIINVNEKVIAAHLGMYSRWKKGKGDIEVIPGEPREDIDEFKREFQAQVRVEIDSFKEDLPNVIRKVMEKVLEKEKEDIAPPTTPPGASLFPPPVIYPGEEGPPETPSKQTPEELRDLKAEMEKQRTDLQIEKERVEMKKQQSEFLDDLVVQKKELRKHEVKIEKAEKFLKGKGKEPEEEELEPEEINVELCKLVKVIKEVNPRTFKNILKQRDPKIQKAIKNILP